MRRPTPPGGDPVSSYLAPRASLTTHEVQNQPPPLADYDAFELDVPLREGVAREGAA